MYSKIVATLWVACALADVRAQRRSTLNFELIMPREVYLLGENINVDVKLTNTGSTPLDAPRLVNQGNSQPVYTLHGPSYPNGVHFDFRKSRPEGIKGPVPPDSTFRVLPGAVMEDGFNLVTMKPVSEPGEYTLSARIDFQGWSAEAPPVKFRVEKAKFVESSLGVDVYARSASSLRAVWIAESAGRRLLGESFLYEKRPDLGEVTVKETRIIRTIPAKASEPFCPWLNYDYMSAPKSWHGWREGSALVALSDNEKEPRTFEMGSAKDQIVHPALLGISGDLDVLVLGGNRKTLRMVRFPATPGAGNHSMVLWTTELPEESAAMRLGVGPQAQGGSRVAVSVSQNGAKLALRLIRISDKAAEVGQPVTIDMGFALPDSRPSVAIGPDGSVQASVLFAKHPGLRTLAVADLTVSREGESRVKVTDVGLAPAAVTRAWTEHTVTEGRQARQFLIRTFDGQVFSGIPLARIEVKGSVADFLLMSVASYVLAVDPDRGPMLQATGQ